MRKHQASIHQSLAHGVVAAAAIAALAVGVLYGTFAAADTDPYGYLSEAEVLARGSLRIDQRSLQDVPWPNAEATFSPFGWRPATVHGFIVPIYAPGLPLVMAAFQRVFGRPGAFCAVPILGALAVWAVGRLGTVVHSSFVGASSAVLLATSPTFLRHLVQPVSDVPTMAWWTLSLALASAGGKAAALGAGSAASMAILTRPNLVPLAVIPGILVLLPRAADAKSGGNGTVSLLLLIAGVVPGCVAIGVVNWLSNGSPLLSGYGTLDYLYSFANVVPNLDRYPRWLWEQETPLIYLALLAPLAVRWRGAHTAQPRSGHMTALLFFALATLLLYLPFSVFGRTEWDYLRFILPGIPALIVLSMAVMVDIATRFLPRKLRMAGVLAPVIVILGLYHVRMAAQMGTFTAAISEKRYVDVGRYIALATPREAAFISGLHSGTIRYYAERLTIRYDQIEPDWLDRTIAYMGSHGHPTYIVVEEGEESIFRNRFGSSSTFGRLDWPASVERFEPIHVRIYDPDDRARYLAGGAIITADIGFVGQPRLHQQGRDKSP
jgi:hypothetical protein